MLNYFFIQIRCTGWQKQAPEVFFKKKVFLEISQNSQENTCTEASFLIKLQANFIKKQTVKKTNLRNF